MTEHYDDLSINSSKEMEKARDMAHKEGEMSISADSKEKFKNRLKFAIESNDDKLFDEIVKNFSEDVIDRNQKLEKENVDLKDELITLTEHVNKSGEDSPDADVDVDAYDKSAKKEDDPATHEIPRWEDMIDEEKMQSFLERALRAEKYNEGQMKNWGKKNELVVVDFPVEHGDSLGNTYYEELKQLFPEKELTKRVDVAYASREIADWEDLNPEQKKDAYMRRWQEIRDVCKKYKLNPSMDTVGDKYFEQLERLGMTPLNELVLSDEEENQYKGITTTRRKRKNTSQDKAIY